MEMLVLGERTGAEDRESKHRARGRDRVERRREEERDEEGASHRARLR